MTCGTTPSFLPTTDVHFRSLLASLANKLVFGDGDDSPYYKRSLNQLKAAQPSGKAELWDELTSKRLSKALVADTALERMEIFLTENLSTDTKPEIVDRQTSEAESSATPPNLEQPEPGVVELQFLVLASGLLEIPDLDSDLHENVRHFAASTVERRDPNPLSLEAIDISLCQHPTLQPFIVLPMALLSFARQLLGVHTAEVDSPNAEDNANALKRATAALLAILPEGQAKLWMSLTKDRLSDALISPSARERIELFLPENLSNDANREIVDTVQERTPGREVDHVLRTIDSFTPEQREQFDRKLREDEHRDGESLDHITGACTLLEQSSFKNLSDARKNAVIELAAKALSKIPAKQVPKAVEQLTPKKRQQLHAATGDLLDVPLEEQKQPQQGHTDNWATLTVSRIKDLTAGLPPEELAEVRNHVDTKLGLAKPKRMEAKGIIRELQTVHGMSARRIAEAIDSSHTTINAITADKRNPSSEVWGSLMDLLDRRRSAARPQVGQSPSGPFDQMTAKELLDSLRDDFDMTLREIADALNLKHHSVLGEISRGATQDTSDELHRNLRHLLAKRTIEKAG